MGTSVELKAKEERIEGLEVLNHGGLTWISIEKPTQESIRSLARRYPFHALNLEDCLSKVQLTKIDEHEGYVFVVLHFPTFSEQRGVIVSSQLSVFLGDNYLVTIHQGDLKPLVDIYNLCKKDENQRQGYMGEDSSYLLYRIIDRLVDDVFPILDKMLRDLDSVEDRVFDEKREAIREVTSLRREIADLRRIILPLKMVTVEVAMKAQVFAKQDHSAYFSDVKDHIEKVWRTLEECKDTIEIYKDTDFMLSVERTNKILSFLTIFFTLSIPATLVGTFYGMNITLPGGIEAGAWMFFGPYTTLLVLIIASIVPALVMLGLFHLRGWI